MSSKNTKKASSDGRLARRKAELEARRKAELDMLNRQLAAIDRTANSLASQRRAIAKTVDAYRRTWDDALSSTPGLMASDLREAGIIPPEWVLADVAHELGIPIRRGHHSDTTDTTDDADGTDGQTGVGEPGKDGEQWERLS